VVDPPRLLDVPGIADLLSFEPATVRDMARRGILPAFKIAGQWRFRADEIADWVEAQRHEVASTEPAPPRTLTPPRARGELPSAREAVRNLPRAER